MKEIDVDTWLDILGNAYRRKILRMLSFKPMYPQELARVLGVTPRAVINHLDQLEKLGIVDRKERKRKQGGRDLHVFQLPQKAFFSFEISNPSCFTVKYAKSKWQPVRWDDEPQQDQIDIKKDFEEEDVKKIQVGLQELWEFHKEIQELDNRRLELMRKREEQFKTISDFFKDKKLATLIIVLYRVLLDRYGTTGYWTPKDVMEIANVDYDNAYKLIQILEEDLKVAVFDNSRDPRNPSWRLKTLPENQALN
ncbi:MAG: ArsR/SmtB family transcription factor [Candidatus Hodarchaeota archaeon]